MQLDIKVIKRKMRKIMKREKEVITMMIEFMDTEHRNFFMQIKHKCRQWDVYHQSLFYALGICPDCRAHINDIFNFSSTEDYGIRPDVINDTTWQTSGSIKCVRLGFNLFNDYVDKGTIPSDLFLGEYGKYLLNAVKLRFREDYCTEFYDVFDEKGHILQENVLHLLAESYVQIHEKEHGEKFEIKPHKAVIAEV